MDFDYPPEATKLRHELRTWLDTNLTERLQAAGWANAGDNDHEDLSLLREWNAKLADAGYAAIAWPEEYGGRGAGVMEQVVLAEEMSRADAPGTLNPIGIANIAPSIMVHGTEEQKRRLLPRMLRGDDIWCQGFSEPDAGSDLASLRTSAVLDGDHYVVNGQKVWNTLGHLANWCELLVRTDPSVSRHQGISCLLVDMTLPGIEVRPLVTITGERDFNEIFFTDVRVPTSSLLGPENDGWRVAITTLTHERGGVAGLHVGLRKRIRTLLDVARSTTIGGRPASHDPVLRQRLASVYLEGELLKLLSDRALSAAIHGREMGPESSLAKLAWAEAGQHLAEVAADVLGAVGADGPWARDLVSSRSLTIAGGTSEVNKNIIAQRILGLPRSS